MKTARPIRFLLLGVWFLALGLPLSLQADPTPDKLTTFFVGRLKYAQNDGDDCGTVAQELGHLLGKASTIEVQDEKKIRLSDLELANLRKYFTHGGFLLGSGCCNAPGFPLAWRREMSRVFPGSPVRKIPYDHIIYRTFYKMDRLRALDKNEDIQLDGLFYGDQLVAVMCEDGLCCSFAMGNECNAGHGLAPDDGRKIALNIAVYALTH